jgi:hypothetical protein
MSDWRGADFFGNWRHISEWLLVGSAVVAVIFALTCWL